MYLRQGQSLSYRLFLLLTWICSLLSCGHPDRKGKRGMYYWKTNVSLSAPEQETLQQLDCQRLFVRFFDVDLGPGGRIVPVAPASFAAITYPQEIVPVVFITPAALNQLNRFSAATLAQQISGLLEQKCRNITLQPKEIQIDCDWSSSNKELYFNLLHQLKRQSFFTGKCLSVTIRLHQVKYIVKSGIPPADRGLLMCYNMGKLKDIKEDNSILNVATAETYLDNLKHYPLPLDVALPIFHWSILFEREQFKGILRDIDLDQLQDKSLFLPQTKQTFLVAKDTFWNGFDLKQGQWIRYEESAVRDVQKLATFVADHIGTDSLTVLLYHCDPKNFKKYTPDELEKIFTCF